MTGAGKILDAGRLAAALERRRRRGDKVVFTNGCFDLLHAGHVRYLAAARREGDLLVVGLNADASVRAIKGSLRPVTPQDQRAEVLAALACVDYVVVFDEADPGRLIAALRPDVLVKGADWAEGAIVGSDTVTAGGGRVVRIPLVTGVSTTGLIERIAARFGPAPGAAGGEPPA